MTLKVNITEPTNHTHSRFEFVRYGNGTALCYFDAETANGYDLYCEVPQSKQAFLATMFIESITQSSFERLCELANKCRTENTDQSLSSMLRELDSTLQEIKDLTAQ